MEIHTEEYKKASQKFHSYWRKEKIKLRKYDANADSKAGEMEHGWLFPMLCQMDTYLWGRWKYHNTLFFRSAENKYVLELADDEVIPQIDFMGHAKTEVNKMLLQCINELAGHGAYDFNHCMEYFIDWLLWSFGHISQPERPEPTRVVKDAHERLYQLFQLGWLQVYPYDYFGDIFAENNTNRRLGFFPTPICVCQLMAQITMGKPGQEDLRLATVGDPGGCGTGRLPLVASNYSLAVSGQDISALMIKTTLVNSFLYAPWIAMPIPGLQSDLLIGDALLNELGTSIHSAPDNPRRIPLYRPPETKVSVEEEESEEIFEDLQPVGWQLPLF